MVNLATLLPFWKKKEASAAPEATRIIPLPKLNLETVRSTSPEAVKQAREELKLLKLERQILGSALTTIYESQTKGLITQPERDMLLEKYKVDLKRLERSIDEKQRLVDLFDLESEREKLIRNFKTRLAELDDQIDGLKSNAPRRPKSVEEEKPQPAEHRRGTAQDESGEERPKEKKTPEEGQEISEAEKRIEQIREEILKAMDRLEQIEAEG